MIESSAKSNDEDDSGLVLGGGGGGSGGGGSHLHRHHPHDTNHSKVRFSQGGSFVGLLDDGDEAEERGGFGSSEQKKDQTGFDSETHHTMGIAINSHTHMSGISYKRVSYADDGNDDSSDSSDSEDDDEDEFADMGMQEVGRVVVGIYIFPQKCLYYCFKT